MIMESARITGVDGSSRFLGINKPGGASDTNAGHLYVQICRQLSG